jgi:hypothetical protein
MTVHHGVAINNNNMAATRAFEVVRTLPVSEPLSSNSVECFFKEKKRKITAW